ncbi:MAG: TFIIB-type zinc ribbon-containing protein [Johnsonella sp.]|nr:TFIIB-type zinc ribbon-containing protein [Johnsonella sp.]
MGVISYKCPSCGGPLKFDPATQKQICEYCESLFTQEELERFYQETLTKSEEEEVSGEEAAYYQADAQGLLYTCPSCAAQIVTDETTAATFCYYCHSPVVLSGRLDGLDTPDYIIPFRIDRAQAEKIFFQWLERKKFVPKSFYSREQVDKLSGVYFPYWLYSCKADALLDANAVRISKRVSGNTEYTYKDSYHIRREGEIEISNITRNALKKANRILTEGVMPFEYTAIQDFDMAYLSGFVAEVKDIDKAEFEREVYMEAEQFAVQRLDAVLAGYTEVALHQKELHFKEGAWKYALMPVWTITYRDKHKSKLYYFSINGHSGKVIGELPIDGAKLFMAFLSIFMPLMLLILLIGYFFI